MAAGPLSGAQSGPREKEEEHLMAVYVDDAFIEWRGRRWCHLQADSTEELHQFALRLGLRPEWFQTRPGRPDRDHYDITDSMRERAIALGAQMESTSDGARRRRAARHGAGS
jgi:hypothetical protein